MRLCWLGRFDVFVWVVFTWLLHLFLWCRVIQWMRWCDSGGDGVLFWFYMMIYFRWYISKVITYLSNTYSQEWIFYPLQNSSSPHQSQLKGTCCCRNIGVVSRARRGVATSNEVDNFETKSAGFSWRCVFSTVPHLTSYQYYQCPVRDELGPSWLRLRLKYWQPYLMY